nr:hypothetical protein CFP56_65870 [Quercus suber]
MGGPTGPSSGAQQLLDLSVVLIQLDPDRFLARVGRGRVDLAVLVVEVLGDVLAETVAERTEPDSTVLSRRGTWRTDAASAKRTALGEPGEEGWTRGDLGLRLLGFTSTMTGWTVWVREGIMRMTKRDMCPGVAWATTTRSTRPGRVEDEVGPGVGWSKRSSDHQGME